ncbi:hypothetical protein SCE1572_40250 [Sorangium cellulosum So0157-2]|uniref:Uncharacterized protein n=1 Tax=Sorangium cellulosum So0157-2 TaxID=1254432 RepID=S4Y409_SORCE|nr:hypothetical protein SCE1572_40250 [Sorangium cellulosum So0157-2]
MVELTLLLDEEDVVVPPLIVPPLPVTETTEGRPVPFAQKPNSVDLPWATDPLWPTFVAVNCPPDPEAFAFHTLFVVEPLSPTTTLQPVSPGLVRVLFVTFTLAQ